MTLPDHPGQNHRPPYDDAFKREALNLWKTSGRSARAIAKEVGVSAASIYSWAREAQGGSADHANASEGGSTRHLQAEVARLRLENERLKQQCEILKKTLGILAEPSRPHSIAP